MSSTKYGIKRIDCSPMYFANGIVAENAEVGCVFSLLMFDTRQDAQTYIDNFLDKKITWRIDPLRILGGRGAFSEYRSKKIKRKRSVKK